MLHEFSCLALERHDLEASAHVLPLQHKSIDAMMVHGSHLHAIPNAVAARTDWTEAAAIQGRA